MRFIAICFIANKSSYGLLKYHREHSKKNIQCINIQQVQASFLNQVKELQITYKELQIL